MIIKRTLTSLNFKPSRKGLSLIFRLVGQSAKSWGLYQVITKFRCEVVDKLPSLSFTNLIMCVDLINDLRSG